MKTPVVFLKTSMLNKYQTTICIEKVHLDDLDVLDTLKVL